MPEISIILTSFNHAKYLRDAIDSVLVQSFEGYELIIWDDASSDESWAIINEYNDPRIRIFRNEKQMRGVWGINKAIKDVARGKYIAIHHSDDVWEPDKLEKQLAFLESHPEYGAVFTHVSLIDEDGNVFTQADHSYAKIFDQPNRNRYEWLRFFFLSGNALCHPSALIRKQSYDVCGTYRYGMAQLPDFDMWVRLCLKYDIYVLEDELVRFRIRDDEANASGDKPETRIRIFFEYYQSLLSYTYVDGFDELTYIFPEAKKYYRGDQSSVKFALAMVALELKPTHFVELIGLNIIFDLLQDEARANRIKSEYNFDYMNFVSLTAKHDPFGIRSIHERNKQIAILNSDVKSLEGKIAELVDDRDNKVKQLSSELTERDTKINMLASELEVNNEKHNKLAREVVERDRIINDLNNAAIERNDYIRSLLGSSSWRITAPLRKIALELKRVFDSIRSAGIIIVRLLRLIKNIPIAISRWGFSGFLRRAIQAFRDGGVRGLLKRAELFRLSFLKDASYSGLSYERQQNYADASKSALLGAHGNTKITYVINRHDLMTHTYRVHNYSEVLAASGYTCSIIYNDEIDQNAGMDSDLLVLNRIPWSESVGYLIRHFRDAGRPVIFDIDDFIIDGSKIDLLRFTRELPDVERNLVLSNMQRLHQTITDCDIATVSTFALKIEIEKYGIPAYVLPNCNSLAVIELAKRLRKHRSERNLSLETVRIGYFSGTKTHEEDFAVCAEALQRVLETNPHAELVIAGHLDLPVTFENVDNKIDRLPLMTHMDMLEKLSTIDINMAPLEADNIFTDCKSELKIFEAALLEIPTVASPTSSFSAIIENGRNGYLAARNEEWFSALTELVRDPVLRRKIGRKAYEQIASRYSVNTTAEEAKAIYQAAITRHLRPSHKGILDKLEHANRPYITIVSVLYKKAKEVRFFLEALRRQDFPGWFEIVLVDDKSPDDSIAVVQDFQRWASCENYDGKRMDIRIIRNPANVGNCGSRNAAISDARGDIVIVVDADCMFNRSFLSSHYLAHSKGDCDVAIGPINIESGEDPPLSVLGRYEAIDVLAEIQSQPQDPFNLDSFVNCITRNFSIQKSFISEQLGGFLFDEAFAYSADPASGFGWEDVEMGYRIYNTGGRIKYLNDTVSIHVSHESSANDDEKPARSLRNYRRLFEKHPDILTASRQWSIRTYEAIIEWMRSVGADLNDNADYKWLKLRFRRYEQAPIVIQRKRKLRILSYRWHVPHQYELYKIGHDFTLLTGTGTSLCDSWEVSKRPMPNNARMVPEDRIDPREYDLAILHFDENMLRPDLCNGKVPDDWGNTFKWFLENIDLPKVAICHGTPQFAGQYNGNYHASDLGQVIEEQHRDMVDLLDDVHVVCNSYQAQSEWGFRNSRTIWHGFSPHEYPPGSRERDVLVMMLAALRNRPHYNGLYIYERTRHLVGGRLDFECFRSSDPLAKYVPASPEWAVAQYQNYTREIGAFSVYFNPTVRSPMPRSRAEAMMAGLVSVSLRNHDVDLFIKNGINGFFADTPDELAEQILWLADHPRQKEKIGIASRVTAMDIFNQDRYLADWTRLLNTIVS